MLSVFTTHTQKGTQEILGGVGYVYYLDFSYYLRCSHISKLITLYTLNMCSSLSVNYTPIKVFLKQEWEKAKIPKLICLTYIQFYNKSVKRNDRHKVQKGKCQTFSFATVMVVYIENPKESTRQPWVLIGHFWKVEARKNQL